MSDLPEICWRFSWEQYPDLPTEFQITCETNLSDSRHFGQKFLGLRLQELPVNQVTTGFQSFTVSAKYVVSFTSICINKWIHTCKKFKLLNQVSVPLDVTSASAHYMY